MVRSHKIDQMNGHTRMRREREGVESSKESITMADRLVYSGGSVDVEEEKSSSFIICRVDST